MSRAWLVLVVACRVVPPPGVTVVEEPARKLPEAKLSVTDTALGPLGGKTPATLVALRGALTGFDVMPVNVDDDVDADTKEKMLEYKVFDRGEQLLRVVPSEEGGILHVLITSARVAIAQRDWRVGSPFAGTTHFTECACWGGKPVCFKRGDHVAVGFDRKCGETRSERHTRRLEGVLVEYLVWSPRGFGASDEDGGEEYGIEYPDP